jgi:superfamily II DNA or RNA helicase
MIQLYDYQQDLEDDIFSAWSDGAKNVLAVLPTGGGKTVLFADIIRKHVGACVCIAHRQEIVSQISLALARNGVRHKVIGPQSLATACVNLHMIELKRHFVDTSSRVAVAGVDTLIRRDPKDPWFASVTLVVQDEAHHVLKVNKWGKVQSMFPNARGLGVTATPIRADGAGLGTHHDGIFNWMVEGPSMRELIHMGKLTEYRIFAPPSDLVLDDVPLSASGDFSPVKLAAAVGKSHIVGDTVTSYLKIAKGKRGVTFSVNVEEATKQAAAFRAAGVPAEVVTANTPDALRGSLLRQLKAGTLLQLVNVDLFGEGMDLPAIEVVSMARPTQSYSLYAQQFGRALRTLPGKTHAIIIDHARNVHRHGLPDAPRRWTLDRRDRKARDNKSEIPIKACPKCTQVYEGYLKICPYCGWQPVPAERGTPEQVEGDLYELSEEALAKLRGEIDKPPMFPFNAAPVVVASIKKNHREKQEVQQELREKIALWAGRHSDKTDERSVSELQRRFFLTFGIDVATAQMLNVRDAENLIKRIGA